MIMLRVPPSGRFLELLRTTVGRIAHLAEFSFDGIEDMALAVDEAAVLILEYRPTGLELAVRETESGLALEVTGLGISEVWPPEGLEEDTRWLILSTVSEHSWIIRGDPAGIGLAQSSR